jgi:hypothetical protein
VGGNERFVQKMATINIALFQSNKAGKISLLWNDNNSENDDT